MTDTMHEPQPGPPWSYSQLKAAESCLKRWYHYSIQKDVREPESEALREGNALHKAFENRIVYGREMPAAYAKYEVMLGKVMAPPGVVVGEQKLAITGSFQPCTYFDKAVWFRTVIDALRIQGDQATILDWKTGKVADDPTQLELMAAATFIHYPTVARVKAGLVFVNFGQVVNAEFTRDSQAEIWG